MEEILNACCGIDVHQESLTPILRNKVINSIQFLSASFRLHSNPIIASEKNRVIKVLETAPSNSSRFSPTYLEKAVAKSLRTLRKERQTQRTCQAYCRTCQAFETTIASAVMAEIGADMDQFPSDQHISSWTGLSPRSYESAGKKST